MLFRTLYDETCRYYLVAPPLASAACFFIDAPFGRFSLPTSRFNIPGISSWIIMELFAPLSFTVAFLSSPLSSSPSPPPLSHPASFLAGLFLIHYSNRALISPLRTPSRNKSHLIVFLCGVAFNIVNGTLLGTWLTSPVALNTLRGAFSDWRFWIGVAGWVGGFVGNVAHDEILLDIRRQKSSTPREQNHYAIPHGLLYSYISYPNYFCEWIEWLSFALIASPPHVTGFLTPPWLFFFAEVWTMFPRAVSGHRWYHKKFDDYPKDRKIIIPFVL
ncbi:hypothetical protein SISNIDRAFT_476046 [Sistotremastrum niveocremeum HHB9708]|uniref:3-oxo-5-alpha-steroid 4-dehydrogenase C-terminal domain-containing protein n=2 Tax=Sistotremastraceae TaxID=3402574 RepID=A0A164P212_9AGAM|nr:hypothetical protein SISNIDRAFT_476046 [Sistotremastrum niveocremeum HHB9708]KZT39325.1 hypothetical protein SISSUDRAFT_1070568 [Sistotremastrum suecicum HHB10207 ss-3]